RDLPHPATNATGQRPRTNFLALERNSMGISATELAEAPVGSEEAPQDKKLAGRSPTQIALTRLRHDRVALVCLIIVGVMGLWVLSTLFGPLTCKALTLYPRAETIPYDPSNVLDFETGLPLNGPPNHGFWLARPLGLAPQTAVDNLARLLYGLRTSLFVATM